MERNNTIALALIAGLFVAITLQFSYGAPTGASVLSNTTAGTPSSTAGNLTTQRGTITTIVIDATQQDQNWKAYVGNVSGRLSLDDASGFTIYDWTLAGGVSGEVYVTRAASPNFDNVSCANEGNVTAEHPTYNMTEAQSDSINQTFNYTNHAAFFVGTIQIAADSCKSIATYVNDAEQAIDGTQVFQEMILQDNSSNLIYTTIMDDNTAGYDNQVYDFQMIVPENDVNSTPTTYFFYTELGS